MYLASFFQDPDFIRVLYIIAFVCFIVGLRFLNHPRTARGATRSPRWAWRSRWWRRCSTTLSATTC